MKNYPNLPLHFLEHSICDRFRVTYPIFKKKIEKKFFGQCWVKGLKVAKLIAIMKVVGIS
jgi:hypothetical protein